MAALHTRNSSWDDWRQKTSRAGRIDSLNDGADLKADESDEQKEPVEREKSCWKNLSTWLDSCSGGRRGKKKVKRSAGLDTVGGFEIKLNPEGRLSFLFQYRFLLIEKK